MRNIFHYLKSPALSGLTVTVLIALFVRYGISFVLFLFDTWELSKINTIILYGLLFIIARVRVRVKSKKRTAIDENISWDEIEDIPDEKEQASKQTKLSAAIWAFFGLYSVLWLTPALIIYWIYTDPYPSEMVGLLTYLFSTGTGVVYFYWNGKKVETLLEKTVYFLGVFAGPVVALYVIL